MKILNTSLKAVLPLIPKGILRPLAMRYVAGETDGDALDIVQELNQKGFSATLDILGEHSESYGEAIQVTKRYKHLYQVVSDSSLNCNISVKLTHLGLGFDYLLAEANLLSLLKIAKETGNFLRIDMENSTYTDTTLTLYEKCKANYSAVGPVLQAYLRRSIDDLKLIFSKNLNVRICKGIYREPEDIAFQDEEAIRQNFIELVQTGLSNGGTICIASHDIYIIDTLERWVTNKQIPKNQYEFQALYGVPMGDRLDRLIDDGHRVRYYIPFGDEWYSYAIRRLKENPKIASFILKDFFKQ